MIIDYMQYPDRRVWDDRLTDVLKWCMMQVLFLHCYVALKGGSKQEYRIMKRSRLLQAKDVALF